MKAQRLENKVFENKKLVEKTKEEIVAKNKDDIDVCLKHMMNNNVKIHKDKKIHRDNSVSFYVEDPDGNILQILWHPTLSNDS